VRGQPRAPACSARIRTVEAEVPSPVLQGVAFAVRCAPRRTEVRGRAAPYYPLTILESVSGDTQEHSHSDKVTLAGVYPRKIPQSVGLGGHRAVFDEWALWWLPHHFTTCFLWISVLSWTGRNLYDHSSRRSRVAHRSRMGRARTGATVHDTITKNFPLRKVRKLGRSCDPSPR
jgi:hypothetical protein